MIFTVSLFYLAFSLVFFWVALRGGILSLTVYLVVVIYLLCLNLMPLNISPKNLRKELYYIGISLGIVASVYFMFVSI